MNNYTKDRIESKIDAKILHHMYEVNYYFKNRHIGLAGIDQEMVVNLCKGAIRDLKVWQQLWVLTHTNNHI